MNIREWSLPTWLRMSLALFAYFFAIVLSSAQNSLGILLYLLVCAWFHFYYKAIQTRQNERYNDLGENLWT